MVIISSSVAQSAYTGNTTGHCWISTKEGLIWSFLGPIYFILFINTVILVTSAIRIATARKQKSQLIKLRGFLISATVLTPALGLPWLVSLAKIATAGVENHIVQEIIDKFIDWVFICLNAPAGIIFLIIVANRFKEFRKANKNKNKQGISTRLTSVTSGVNTLNRPKPIPSGANKYRKPTSRATTDSNPKRLIPVHSERIEIARFAPDENFKEIDNDKKEIPAGCPPRPNLPQCIINPFSPQSSVDQSMFVCEEVNLMHKNPTYISIEDLTRNASATNTTEEINASGNGAKEGTIYQNLSTIEQGAMLKECPIVSDDLAIPNPLFDPLEQIEVDVPVTAALRSSQTSLSASTVSLHKLSSGKNSKNNTTFANVNAGFELTGETEDFSSRNSPLFERETDEGLLRRSLKKIRSSFKLSQSTISPQPTPEPPKISQTPIEPPSNQKQSSNIHPNKYIEHLNKLYQDKKKLPAMKSTILENLLTKPAIRESSSPSPTPKLPAPYAGSRVKNLMEKFDSINTEMQPINKPPIKPPTHVQATGMHLPTIKTTTDTSTNNILQKSIEVESEVSQSISSIEIDEQPPSLRILSTDYNNPFKTTSFTQVSFEVQSPIKPTVKTVPSPVEQRDSTTEVPYPQEPQPPVKLRQTRFSIDSTSYDQDEASCSSSAISSPTKSIILNFQSQSDITKVPDTTNPETIRKPRSPRKIVIRPHSSTYQNNNAGSAIDSSSHSPVKLRQMQFSSFSSNSCDQDTISNSSSTESPTKPITFTYKPPQDLTMVSATRFQEPISTNAEIYSAKGPKVKLSRTNAIEDDHYALPPTKPKPTIQLNTQKHGAFTAPLRPSPPSTAKTSSTPVAKLSDPSGLLSPTRKRSNSRISDKISFFDGVSENESSKTLPRPAKTSINQTLSTAEAKSQVQGLLKYRDSKSGSLSNSNTTCESEPISPPTAKSPPILETTEALQTEL